MKERIITQKNYFETISDVGEENLPAALKQSHEIIVAKTDHGSDWSKYQSDKNLKKVVDLSFQKLREFIKSNGLEGHSELDGTQVLSPREAAIEFIRPYLEAGDTIYLAPGSDTSEDFLDFSAHVEGSNIVVTKLYGTDIRETFNTNELIRELSKEFYSPEAKNETSRKQRQTFSHKQPEFTVLSSFLKWHKMLVAKQMVKAFLSELKGYFEEGTVSEKSKVYKEIKLVYDKLSAIQKSMGENIRIELTEETRKLLREALKKVTDPKKKSQKRNKGLSGVKPEQKTQVETKPEIISSHDLQKISFPALGFQGKWKELIGDPSPGFTAMVYGLPKMGKSYLCIDFAGYLARNHGEVLYVTREEYMSPTFSKKLTDKNVAHERLIIAGELPKDLSAYKFIFLDSVSSMKLSADDLAKLKAENPGKSFIYIFQTTKNGKFRGTNEFQHNVDIVIEVPERGKAVQFGRFNQGGQINIFGQDSYAEKKEDTQVDSDLNVAEEVPTLLGVKREEMKKKSNKTSVKKTARVQPKSEKAVKPSKTKISNQKKMLNKYDNMPDEFHPRFIFSQTYTPLLSDALQGKFDIIYLIRRELANRGVDQHGKWVGFDKAAKIHKIED